MPTPLQEITAHLGAVLAQTIPSDDQIIIDHVRKAHAIAQDECRKVVRQDNVSDYDRTLDAVRQVIGRIP